MKKNKIKTRSKGVKGLKEELAEITARFKKEFDQHGEVILQKHSQILNDVAAEMQKEKAEMLSNQDKALLELKNFFMGQIQELSNSGKTLSDDRFRQIFAENKALRAEIDKLKIEAGSKQVESLANITKEMQRFKAEISSSQDKCLKELKNAKQNPADHQIQELISENEILREQLDDLNAKTEQLKAQNELNTRKLAALDGNIKVNHADITKKQTTCLEKLEEISRISSNREQKQAKFEETFFQKLSDINKKEEAQEMELERERIRKKEELVKQQNQKREENKTNMLFQLKIFETGQCYGIFTVFPNAEILCLDYKSVEAQLMQGLRHYFDGWRSQGCSPSLDNYNIGRALDSSALKNMLLNPSEKYCTNMTSLIGAETRDGSFKIDSDYFHTSLRMTAFKFHEDRQQDCKIIYRIPFEMTFFMKFKCKSRYDCFQKDYSEFTQEGIVDVRGEFEMRFSY